MATPFLSVPPHLGEPSCLGISPPFFILHLLHELCPQLVLKHNSHIEELFMHTLPYCISSLNDLKSTFTIFHLLEWLTIIKWRVSGRRFTVKDQSVNT